MKRAIGLVLLVVLAGCAEGGIRPPSQDDASGPVTTVTKASPLLCGDGSQLSNDLTGSWATRISFPWIGQTWNTTSHFNTSASQPGPYYRVVIDCPTELQPGCTLNGIPWSVIADAQHNNNSLRVIAPKSTSWNGWEDFDCNWNGTSTFTCQGFEDISHTWNGSWADFTGPTGGTGRVFHGAPMNCELGGLNMAGSRRYDWNYAPGQTITNGVVTIGQPQNGLWFAATMNMPDGTTRNAMGTYTGGGTGGFDLFVDGTYGNFGQAPWRASLSPNAGTYTGIEFYGPYHIVPTFSPDFITFH